MITAIIVATIVGAVFIAGRFVGIGPFAPPLSLEEQIAEAEALENFDIEGKCLGVLRNYN